jgi:type IV pilus assembly protein PilW
MNDVKFPSQSGMSLIELMIAITLGLMITTALGYILVGSRATYRTQDANAEVLDTGRNVMTFIGRQIQVAGRPDITPLVSDARVGLLAGTVAITGTNSATLVNYVTAGGVNANRRADTLTVQYQVSDMGGPAPFDCNGQKGGAMGAGSVQINGAPNNTFLYTASNNLNIAANNANAKYPELRCTGNGGGAQAVAEAVEDLQFKYGVDVNGDTSVDCWVDNPTAEKCPGSVVNATWDQVIAVQACILVESTENGVSPTAQRITDCSGTTYVPNDTRLRRTFTSVFTLRNRIMAAP